MSDEWETPPELFNYLNKIFYFDWDACCNAKNCLVPPQLFQIKDWEYRDNYDFLNFNFSDTIINNIFMNPPYSNPRPFIQRAIQLAKRYNDHSITTVALLKYDSTKLFSLYLSAYDNIQVFYRLEDIWYYGENNRSNVQLYLLPERIKFYKDGKPAKSVANFPCCVVVIRGGG